MFSVNVRDHIMIAHSFKGEVFGPAQTLHGATYVVDWELRREQLNADNIVTDIGAASGLLRTVLARLNFQNLDDNPQFAGNNTTTEFVAQVIHNALASEIQALALGEPADAFDSMRVTLHESHIAWAAYDAPISD